MAFVAAAVAVLTVSVSVACGTAPESTQATSTPVATSAPTFTCREDDGSRSAGRVGTTRGEAEDAPEETGTEIVGGIYGDPEAATRYWEQQTEGTLAAETPSQCSPGEPVTIDVFETAWATGDHELLVTAPR
jgi:hypothetical protein